MPEFGTSGLRGLAVEMTDALCEGYTTAFLSGTAHDGSVMIGRDLRDSSPRLRDAVARGAARLGITVRDCGILPTPALALAAQERGTAAIMITGSHIPADRNGLKFYSTAGEITKDDEARITAAFAKLDGAAPEATPEITDEPAALAGFRARYTGFFAKDALKGLRVGVYQHSSVARDLLIDLLADLGAAPVALGRCESFVPVDTEAVDEASRTLLAGWAAEHELDAIVSTDGDADRPMLTDAEGLIVPGDILGPLTARYLGADAVVTPVSSNTVVERSEAFGHITRCKIGSPYVIAQMEAALGAGQGSVVGYEANGGFLLGYEARREGRTLAPLMTRDFALPILATLALAKAEGLSVAELRATLPARATASNRLQDIPREVSLAIVDRVLDGGLTLWPDALGRIAEVDRTDGARLTLESGVIVHIRPSGNAPELRCYVEADAADEADAILRTALGKLADAARIG
ncbi:phosphomannomutase [Poseidonocella sedimentorum]|uniref:Phosphomannomutase n=1 Tax=Poseidonocella sedimentorum TaxID=871652 RepID=A0A1I6DTJ6_9RHOB|nr:phosphomannomutase [Poseidonocella sedimentorum]SFR08804.1 phosphomannomutase [Poseidonocella sedimentorum]